MPKGTPADWLTAADAEVVDLVFPRDIHDDLMETLFPDEGHPFHGMGERGAFAVLTKSTGTRRVSYIVEDVVHPESSDDLQWKGSLSGDGDTDHRRFRSLFGGSSAGDVSSGDQASVTNSVKSITNAP